MSVGVFSRSWEHAIRRVEECDCVDHVAGDDAVHVEVCASEHVVHSSKAVGFFDRFL